MRLFILLALALSTAPSAFGQTNPLWHEEKIKNFLPHMTWQEVRDLLTRTDMVLIPVPSIEQHGPQTPMGTDFYAGVERAKLIAQRTDILVAPVLMVGQSPYHMEFPGTMTLSNETLQRVYFEAAQSLIHHGFRRFLFLNSHAGNQYMTRFVVDRVNQETPAVAIDLGDGVTAVSGRRGADQAPAEKFDRHGGVDAMLVHQVDVVGGEASERALDGLVNMLRPAVHSCDGAVLELEPELGRDDDTVALAVECAGEQCLVGVGPVRLGRVKECHSEFDGSVDGCDGLPIVALFGGAVCKAHPHTAKPDGRHFQVAFSKFALLHFQIPLSIRS